MKIQSSGPAPLVRLLALLVGTAAIIALTSGSLMWCWTETSSVLALSGVVPLPLHDAAHATWQLILHSEWRNPGQALPSASERAHAPGAPAYLLTTVCLSLALGRAAFGLWRALRALRSGSPLGRRHNKLARLVLDRGWVHQRTWATTADLRPWQGHARQFAVLREQRLLVLGGWEAVPAGAERGVLRELIAGPPPAHAAANPRGGPGTES